MLMSSYSTAFDSPSSSPFFQFSRRTIEEHKVILLRLEEQLRLIAQSMADLDTQSEIDNENSSCIILQLHQEEEAVIRKEQQCIQMISRIEAQIAEEDTKLSEKRILLDEKEKATIRDMVVLDDLEEELKEMKASVEERLHRSKEQLRIFKAELNDGLRILETDRDRVLALADRSRLVCEQSQRTRRHADSLSPDRHEGSQSMHRTDSYCISRCNTAASEIYSASELKNISPMRCRTEDISPITRELSPHSASSPHRGLRSPRRPGRHSRIMSDAQMLNSDMKAIRQHSLAGGTSSALLRACANVPVDPAEVTHILRQDPSSINAMDRLDNNALHTVCMNPQPSIDAVHALLLAGCSTATRNISGMTPFHLICMNVDGDGIDHSIKRFLIFKGSQNPNQRTARGQTALHLCAEDDKFIDVAKFLLTVGVEPNVSALLTAVDGSSRRMTAYDVACLGGERTAKMAHLLQSIR
eukprot:Tbor_TRINITY_DN3183_c0_g1::TRINITY_DN3183_c0_g1_i1::g.14763::m.14763